MIRALVFDFFDTLVDFRPEKLPTVVFPWGPRPSTLGKVHESLRGLASPPDFPSFAEALRDLDQRLSETLASGIEVSTKDRFAALARELGLGFDSGLAMARAHLKAMQVAAVFPSEHKRVLQNLHQQRLPLALCSNFTDSDTLHLLLDSFQIRSCFDTIAVSESVGYRKPRPDIFLDAISAWSLEPGDILHLGDRLEEDIRGASNLGLKTAWVTHRLAKPALLQHQYSGPKPDYILEQLDKIPALLGKHE